MTFEGDVQQLDLMAKLVELWRNKFTGALRFENDAVIKIIYFKQGNIISASTNDRADSIDEVLMRAGKVNKEHVKQALSKRKESETLGDALLGLGFITKKELASARRVQLVGVIRSILGWSEGNFTIVADYLPKREEGTIFYVPQIVLELVVTDPDREKFIKALDDGNVNFQKSDDFDTDYPFLGLNEDADRIVELIDGTRSASDIASSSAMDSFNVFKLLHALQALGLIQPAKAQVAPEVFPQADGVFDFQLDDAPTADTEWSLPEEEPLTVQAAPSGEYALSLEDAPAEEFPQPAPDEPLAPPSEDDFEFQSSSSAPVEEWMTPEEEPLGVVSTPASAAATIRAQPTSDFSLKVDPDVLAPAASIHAPENITTRDFDAALTDSRTAEEARADTFSSTRPRAQQRPISLAPKKRSRTPILAATIAIVLVALVGAGWFFFLRPKPAAPGAVAVTPTATPKPVWAPIATAATESTSPASTMPSTTPMEVPVAKMPPVATPVSAASGSAPKPAVTPAATMASSPTRAKYEQMAADFARNANSAEYTVQFELVCQPDSVTRALRDGGGNVWFAPVVFKGNTCFRVFWGHFPSKAAAEAAIGQVPGALRAGSKSAAVKVSEVLK